MTISEYIISIKGETNPRPGYIRYTIQILSGLSRSIGIEKRFNDMTRDDNHYYLYNARKSDNEDPLVKGIGSYNTGRIVLILFLNGCIFLRKIVPRREMN